MTKTQKAISKLSQIAEKLKTDSHYNSDEFLQEAAEDIKSSADLLEMAYSDDLTVNCDTCAYDRYVDCTNCCKGWKWRGDAE